MDARFGGSSVISLGVAAVAVALALAATVVLARQRPSAARAARSRHPAAAPPVTLSLVRDGRDAHWRVDVRTSSPPTAVDIISYRPAGSTGTWETEPIIEPVELRPGGWAVLPSVVVGRAPAYDVVIGWTQHHPDGDVTGSRSVTVHESGPVTVTPPGPQRGWPVVAAVLMVVLIASGAVVVARLVDEWDDDTLATSTDTTAVATTVATTVPPSTAPVTTASLVVPESEPDARPGTTAGTTATPSTVQITSPTSAVTTSPPTSVTTATTEPQAETTVVVGRMVVATGRIDDCRFGTGCLVVGFSITGFDSQPTEYVCEFGDGERVTFTFVGDGAETACSARSATPSITIEVAGVRSDTITPDDLGGTG